MIQLLRAGNSGELLSLPLHPLQEEVPEDARRKVIDQILVTAVSQVGVNLNACVHVDWLAQALPFVPGLGPRKARALVKVRSLLRLRLRTSFLWLLRASALPGVCAHAVCYANGGP